MYHDLRYPNHRPHTMGLWQTIRFDGYMKCSLQGHYIRLIHGEGGVHIWSLYLSVYSPMSCQGIKYTCPTSAPSTLLETDESGYYFLSCKSNKCLHMPTWHVESVSSHIPSSPSSKSVLDCRTNFKKICYLFSPNYNHINQINAIFKSLHEIDKNH